MRDPRSYGAVPIGQLPVVLSHVRTLEAFDTPLIIEFKSERGEPFLQYWCDRENVTTRWMVVRTTNPDLTRYLVGIATTRDLILNCQDKFVYLVDTVRGAHHAVFYVRAEALPEEYVPAEESYSDPLVSINEHEQDIFIDEDPTEAQWGYHQVSEYPRKFLQAYSFNAIFGRSGDARGLGSIGYRLSQGWVYHTLFNNFNAHVSANKRASLAGVSFASPGYVRFKVDPNLASDLRYAVAKYLDPGNTIDSEISALEKWTRETEEDRGSEDEARRALAELCGTLRINGNEVLRRFDSTTAAIKAVASYLRRLSYIAQKDHDRTAMLVGLRRRR